MVNNNLIFDHLENIFQKHWAEIINNNLLIKRVMCDVNSNTFQQINQPENFVKKTSITVTKCNANRTGFCSKDVNSLSNSLELWIEFSIPKDKGTVIGTGIYTVGLNGDFNLTSIFGSHFVPQKLNDV